MLGNTPGGWLFHHFVDRFPGGNHGVDVLVVFHDEVDDYRPRSLHRLAHGVGEWRPLDFCTPYGCSKGAADQYVLDYARSYGVPSAVLRMSCIYGERQMGTEDQGGAEGTLHIPQATGSGFRCPQRCVMCLRRLPDPQPPGSWLEISLV